MSAPQKIFELPPASVDAPEMDGFAGARSPEPLSRSRLILYRFLRRKSGVAGLVVLIGIFLLAFVGPHLTHWRYDDFDQANILAGPGRDHYFGVDEVGLDVYAQTLRGLQKSLFIGMFAAVITTAIAAVAGSVAGYFGRLVDASVVWVIDLLLVLPSFLVLAILSPILAGKS